MLIKKTILLFTTLLLVVSCSKNDDNNNVSANLEMKKDNIVGVWYPQFVIKANGAIEPYHHLCPSEKDAIEIFVIDNIHFFLHNDECVKYSNNEGSSFYDLNFIAGRIENGGEFMTGKISVLTTTLMQIDYDEVTYNISYPENNLNSIKGIILSR